MTDIINMVIVSGADFKKDMKKYLEVLKTQPVYIKIRGKVVAKVVAVATKEG